MSRLNNQKIIEGLRNNDGVILSTIINKYYPHYHKKLVNKGYKAEMIKQLFSEALAEVIFEIRHKSISNLLPFDSFFENQISDKVKNSKNQTEPIVNLTSAIVVSCLNIMEEQSRKLLTLYYADGFNYEQIATQMDFSNAVIAQHEIDKSYRQLEEIVKARLQ